MSKTLEQLKNLCVIPQEETEEYDYLYYNIIPFLEENDKLYDKIEQLEIDIKAYERMHELSTKVIEWVEAGNAWDQWRKDTATVWENRHLYKYLEKKDE